MYTKNDIETIKNTILKEVTPYQIILFGSYAKGAATDDSDIDLMILIQKNISRKEKLSTLSRIERKFLELDYDIDLFLKSVEEYEKYKGFIGTINYQIANEGKILWKKYSS